MNLMLDRTRSAALRFCPLLIACCTVACSNDTGRRATADDSGAAGAVGVSDEPLTIHLAGDSTAAAFAPTDATGRVGWATNFDDLFDDTVHVINSASAGRSSKSFIEQGFWETVKGRLQPGDYVFIQFGHNDAEIEDAERGTDPDTTFRDYLETYVEETSEKDAHPVLLTPISRRNFSGTDIVSTLGEYSAAVVDVADETDAPVIDMSEKTRVWLEELGPSDSVDYFATDDNTHLNTMGANAVAALVAEGITELDLPLADRLLP